jgi:cytochrome c553
VCVSSQAIWYLRFREYGRGVGRLSLFSLGSAAKIRRFNKPMSRPLSVTARPLLTSLITWTLLVLGSAFGLSGCRLGAADAASRGRELFETCVPCHGQAGEGNPEVGAPDIGGMQAWYIETQLRKFRAGARGMHFNDTEGMRMRPMALSLMTDQNVEAVARYVASLPSTRQAPALRGDPKAGAELFEGCDSCHGPAGEGVDEAKAPRLAGVDDWYLATQLRKFKSGVRGVDTRDPEGRLMRPMARSLPDENAIRNVVTYIDTFKSKAE